MAKMAEGAWYCGDPGVQYDTTINRWHTCPNSGRINASNPCSEYMFLDDTACNLASINLMKFRLADGTFDVERFQAACRIFFIAQEILVDHASYPTADIAGNSHMFRPLGLGYSNLGSLIMASGLPYDSDAALGLVRRDDGPVARCGQSVQRRVGRRGGPVRRLSEESRADAGRDADAPRRGREDRRRLPGVSEGRRPRRCGTTCWPAAASRLPQCPGHGAGSDRHDQLPDGLRHDGHRARHRAGEVQAAGRRRHAEDRQPDGAAGACERWATTSRRSSRSWPTSIAKTRSKAPPTWRTSTCRCSTVPSSRATARVRFPGGPTCG